MPLYQISNKATNTLNQVVSSIVIDLQPAEDGAYKTQKNWIALYNAQEGEFKGKRMISAPDVIGASELDSPEALASLQEDCRGLSWVVTGTHTSFRPYTPYKPLAGDVIHNYQSTVVRPKVISLDEIPVLQGVPASKVVETRKGLSYLRALENDMYANPVTLLKRLVALSPKKEPRNIVLWTPDQCSRISYPERAVGFSDTVYKFIVYGNHFDNANGRSRGVLISQLSKRAKK